MLTPETMGVFAAVSESDLNTDCACAHQGRWQTTSFGPQTVGLYSLVGQQCFWHTHQRKNESQRAHRANERLADVNPGRDQVRDRRDVRFRGENEHVCLQVFSRRATADASAAEPWLLTTRGA